MIDGKGFRALIPTVAVAVVAASGCRGISGNLPNVSPSVAEVQARRLRCQDQDRMDGVGQLVGCIRLSGDTTYFLVRTRSGVLFLVGRQLSIAVNASPVLFDSLSRVNTSEFGSDPLRCPGQESQFWRVREARWDFGEWQYVLRESVPRTAASPAALVTMGARRGSADCSTRFDIPFFEGPPR